MDTPEFDPITLEIFWNRLIAITDQAAATLVRTSFSTIVRESNDYACVLMDINADGLAENRGSIPSFVGCLPRTTKHFLKYFPPEEWRPGDVVVTNDPWMGTGHRPDVTMAAPVFRNGKLVAFTGSIAHWADIGGTLWSADCHSVFEEGIGIPPMKLMLEGKPNDHLLEIIYHNVRLPQQVMGDLFAQVAAAEVSGQRLVEFMDEYNLEDLTALSRAIQDRAEEAMRRAISKVPDGVYRETVNLDGFDEPLQIQCAVTVKGEEMEVDFTGTSEQVDKGGINTVFNYTWAYTTYTLKCLLEPTGSRTDGSYRPVKVFAPEGSLLNTTYPMPVNVRNLVGHCVSSALFGALGPALPDQVIADSGATPSFRTTFSGYKEDGQPFTFMLFANGGMGARPTMDGLPCTPFPTNSTAASIEVMEALAPLRVWKKQIRQDSGGAGKFRGGYGQDIVIEMTSPQPITISVISERWDFPPQGLMGGRPGVPTRVAMVNGEQPMPRKGKAQLLPGDIVQLSYAGGGGYGPPEEREIEQVQQDLRDELISPEVANSVYGLDHNG